MWFGRHRPSEQEQRAAARREMARVKLEKAWARECHREWRYPRATPMEREEIDSYLRLGFTLDEVLEWAEQWELRPLAVYAEKRVSDAYDEILAQLERLGSDEECLAQS